MCPPLFISLQNCGISVYQMSFTKGEIHVKEILHGINGALMDEILRGISGQARRGSRKCEAI